MERGSNMKDIEKSCYSDWRNSTLTARMATDKKYLILRMGNFLISTAGFGWYVIYVLRGIRFAIENDFIPVVDWQNCKLPQYDPDKIGKENIWERFFEQPFNVGVMQAYASNDYFVVDDIRSLPFSDTLNIESFTDYHNEDVVCWREYFQCYIRLKKEVKEYFKECRNQFGLQNKKMIGVLARGTDYRDLKPVGHCCPISIEEIYQNVDLALNQMDISGIFLATEDRDILENFEKKYPKMVYTVDAKRYGRMGHETLNMIYKEENGYERDLKYLYALYNITKCPVYICAACGGGVLASLMREEEGTNYKFLYHGYNKAKGIIVGSYLEKQKKEIISMGNKPIMFYTLNLIKLLKIDEVDIIISDVLRRKYEKLIGCGESFGLKINYITSKTYEVVEYMVSHLMNIEVSRSILLYTDEFVYGKDVVRDMVYRLNMFDGSYVWGIKNSFLKDCESIRINERLKIPEKASVSYSAGNYELMGRFIFDNELVDIIKQLSLNEGKFVLTDILNEYIKRKKLFFLEYKRGIVSLKIKDLNILKKTDQIINLLEELQGKKIGNFMSYYNSI